MRWKIIVWALYSLCWPNSSLCANGMAGIRQIEPDETTGSSKAVVVPDGPLAHTAQLLPLDKHGQIVGKDQATIQTARVVKNLSAALDEAQSDLDHLVKLNVYVARQEAVPEVRRFLALDFRGRKKPAMSFVVGKLSHPEALVAIDAVGVSRLDSGPAIKTFRSANLPETGCAHVAVLPEGTRIYVSGQAEKGRTPAEAARLTLESLRATLQFLRQQEQDVVQVKAFLTPISEVDAVRKEIERFFDKTPVPPLVFVEWIADLPIEIEVIARGEKIRARNVVEFLTPPGLQPSPVFSRVARLQADRVIYVSGLYGEKAANAEAEVQEIFASLEELLKLAGSDLRHLAKATYYVATAEAGTKLDHLRPHYYDPMRPPAASKALVPGVGRVGKNLTFDMIAVPKREGTK